MLLYESIFEGESIHALCVHSGDVDTEIGDGFIEPFDLRQNSAPHKYYVKFRNKVNFNQKPSQKSIDCPFSFLNWCNIGFKKSIRILCGVADCHHDFSVCMLKSEFGGTFRVPISRQLWWSPD
uniref:AlNc14C24G2444 protein n=1 Tax=Albugo laibachii Nc14 TaxID=890382 RepID=F0W6E5_9STRA|nr:AlNc14C24G2444 [Albugo laibachii Nc14]|eukprot:CCA16689.1 AlNc14C24G2444 [Albugo laibachii Nc14]